MNIDVVGRFWLCALFSFGISYQVATAIRGAIIIAKMSVVPVRRGYWGRKNGLPHTVPNKVQYGARHSTSKRSFPHFIRSYWP